MCVQQNLQLVSVEDEPTAYRYRYRGLLVKSPTPAFASTTMVCSTYYSTSVWNVECVMSGHRVPMHHLTTL
jgi:hypothetical protein